MGAAMLGKGDFLYGRRHGGSGRGSVQVSPPPCWVG